MTLGENVETKKREPLFFWGTSETVQMAASNRLKTVSPSTLIRFRLARVEEKRRRSRTNKHEHFGPKKCLRI